MTDRILNGLKFINISIFCLSLSCAFSQTTEFKGTVRESTTHKPIPFAAIFLANTSFGAAADEDGAFTLKNIPPGKYDLVISSVGFHKLSYPLEFPTANKLVVFELQPDVRELKTVVIEANEHLRKKYYRSFVKYFLGTTPNASHCHIENPDDIYFNYDKGVLTAECTSALIIINEALGYKIHYLLDEFKLDEGKQTLRVFGVPHFEELTATSESQQRKWKRARDVAYNGSLPHFMSSLLQRKLDENYFTLTTVTENLSLRESNFFADSLTSKFEYKGRLRLYYSGEREDYNYSKRPSFMQGSVIAFLNPSLTIYKNGYFEEFKSVELEGYLAWSTVVAELVPLEYKPHTEAKAKL